MDEKQQEALLAAVRKMPPVEGISVSNVLDLPEEVGRVITEVMRQRSMGIGAFAVALGLDTAVAEQLGDLLIEKGVLQAQHRPDGLSYRIKFDRQNRRSLSSKVWDAFET